MESSDQLFRLIHLLNKQEKRYFQLSSVTHREGSTYTLLFDYLNKQSEYNESKIKSHFKGHTFIKQLPVTKHLLYKLILKSMNQYHGDKSVDLQLRELLFSIDFQFEKTLYTECSRSVKKAKDLAEKFEKFEFLLRVLKWEKKLMNVSTNNTLKEAQRIFREEQEALEKLNNISRYAFLQKQVSIISATQAHFRTEQQRKELKKIMKDPLLKDIRSAITFDSRTFFYQIKAYYSRLMEETENSYHYRETLLKLWDAHPHFIREYPSVYIPIVQNMMNAQLDKKSYAAFESTSKKLKATVPKSESDKMLLFLAYYPVKLTHYANILEDDSVIKEAEDDFEIFEKRLREDHVLVFQYLFALCHFLNGNFRSSLKWINSTLNNVNLKVRPDIGSTVLLMNLMVHFELRNFDLMEYIIKTTFRSLLKMERLYEFERTILKFLKDVPAKNTSHELESYFRKLHEALKVLEENPYENKAFKYFDFTSWLESKIEKRSFKEIVKSKRGD